METHLLHLRNLLGLLKGDLTGLQLLLEGELLGLEQGVHLLGLIPQLSRPGREGAHVSRRAWEGEKGTREGKQRSEQGRQAGRQARKQHTYKTRDMEDNSSSPEMEGKQHADRQNKREAGRRRGGRARDSGSNATKLFLLFGATTDKCFKVVTSFFGRVWRQATPRVMFADVITVEHGSTA